MTLEEYLEERDATITISYFTMGTIIAQLSTEKDGIVYQYADAGAGSALSAIRNFVEES